MTLTVTITGADDAVDPAALASLSAEFPFVEWAILFSRKREGSPRYPSELWRKRLIEARYDARLDIDDDDKAQTWCPLAAHFCGEVARDLMAGKKTADRLEFWGFDRWQINGYDPATAAGLREIVAPDLILQCRSEQTFAACCEEADCIFDAAVLFDPSGGTGRAQSWPKRLDAGYVRRPIPFGIAGGIGPDNVSEAIAAAHLLGASWIDMESGVRTDDRFDLAKVRAVLTRAAHALRSRGAA